MYAARCEDLSKKPSPCTWPYTTITETWAVVFTRIHSCRQFLSMRSLIFAYWTVCIECSGDRQHHHIQAARCDRRRSPSALSGSRSAS
jgi:hypothetical protein